MTHTGKPARICIVTPDFTGPIRNGGVGTACFNQAKVLAAAGHDVTILFTGRDEVAWPEHWQDLYRRLHGWTYVDLTQWTELNLDPPDKLANYPGIPQLRISRLALAYLRRQPFDLILFQDYLGHALYPLQYKRAGLGMENSRLCVTIHSFKQWILEGMRQFPGNLGHFIAQQAEIEALHLADTLIAPSRYMADWTSHATGIVPERFTHLPNCYSDDDSAAGEAGPLAFGPFSHLVFFGRLETRKGLHLFVEAIRSSGLLRNRVRRITFLGRHASVLGTPSDLYLQAETAVADFPEWQVLNSFDTHQALAWMRQQTDALIVAPSLSDNHPLSIVELMVGRFPFISTRVGGIPEIVGADNDHLLAEPTIAGLRATLERIVEAGRLEIDFSAGYQPHQAARSLLEFTGKLLASPTPAATVPAAIAGQPAISVIVPHFNSVAYLDVALDTLLSQDLTEPYEIIVVDDHSPEAAWQQLQDLVQRLDDPRLRLTRMPANRGPAASRNHGLRLAKGRYLAFFDADNEALPHMLSTMLQAIRHSGLDCMTCFNRVIKQHDRADPKRLDLAQASVIFTPIGPSLELGAFINAYGDTCSIMAAHVPQAVGGWPENRDSREDWEFFTKVCVHGFGFGVIPDVLYLYRDDRGSRRNLRSNAQNYTGQRKIIAHLASPAGRTRLDLENILGFAVGMSFPNLTARQANANVVYDCFAKLGQEELRAYLDQAPQEDSPAAASQTLTLQQTRRVLYPIVCQWDAAGETRRVLLYGAGDHSKVVLGMVPALWRHLVGFIDTYPRGDYLGLPCFAPDAVDPADIDAIVYSSAVHEQAMFARMQHLPVQHVLLYGEDSR